jgi:hypothetical protein
MSLHIIFTYTLVVVVVVVAAADLLSFHNSVILQSEAKKGRVTSTL